MTISKKPSEQEIAIARVYAQAALSLAEAQGEADEVLAELAGLSDLDGSESGVRRLPDLASGGHRGTSSVSRSDGSRQYERDPSRHPAGDEQQGSLRSGASPGRSVRPGVRGLAWAGSGAGTNRGAPDRCAAPSNSRRRSPATPARPPSWRRDVEPSLLGGLVVQVADRRIDTSVVKEIRGLEQRLLERASHEIHSDTVYFEEAS